MRYFLLWLVLFYSCSSPDKSNDLREDTAKIAALVKKEPEPTYVFEVKEDGTVVPVQTYLKENLKTWVTYKPGKWEISKVDYKDRPKVKYVVKHSYSVKDDNGRLQSVTASFFLDDNGNVLKSFPMDKNTSAP